LLNEPDHLKHLEAAQPAETKCRSSMIADQIIYFFDEKDFTVKFSSELRFLK
jgi:hypothetical protein